jgi:hypothetical protein
MTTTKMTPIRKIEQLWGAMRELGVAAQQRIDATHTHDIYADFEPPRKVGLVVVCLTRPEDPRPLRSLMIDAAQRADKKWALRLSLEDPALEPVFAALCEDVISSTETGVSEADLAAAVARRVQHWRTLLERDSSGLGENLLQGLIGELAVLERRVIQRLALVDAISSWTGPFGAPQDFRLPTGERIEVKAVRGPATSVQINGLGQLDAGGDPLTLAVVRVQVTGATASGAVTAPNLIERLRETLSGEPEIRRVFDRALAALRWHDHPFHDEFAVRILGIDAYVVDENFPKLVAGGVPPGVLDADYTVALIGGHEDWLGG